MGKMTRHWLYCTPIDDAGLAHLPELKGLTAIRLGETKVSDARLKELYRLPALRELYVEKTKVTGKGLFRLHEALPACTFYADPPAMEEYHTLLLGKEPETIGLHKCRADCKGRTESVPFLVASGYGSLPLHRRPVRLGASFTARNAAGTRRVPTIW